MIVLPSVNCAASDCVLLRMKTISTFLPEDGWIHVDISDGRFTFNKTWNDERGIFNALADSGLKANAEVHLMVEEPEKVLESWLRAGAKRIIVHVESVVSSKKRSHLADINDPSEIMKGMAEKCRTYGAELMLALNPETSVHKALELAGEVAMFQILAVTPGFAGQKFLPSVLDKIRALRRARPNAIIEIDGGITVETALEAKRAGADMAVAATAIFESENPAQAYKTLSAL